MNDEVEISITLTVQGGVRHALVEWRPGDSDAVEMAIGIACRQAASGYEFRGIRHEDGQRQHLWLVQQQSAV